MRQPVTIRVNEDLIAKLYAETSIKHQGTEPMQPTERQKQVLLDLWPRGTCTKAQIAEALGVSEGVCRRWYKELTA